MIAVFFLLMILLLQSRAAIIALSGLFLYELFYYMFKPGKFRIKIIFDWYFSSYLLLQ